MDGLDALSKLKGQELHLFLTDINMPKMDGLEFTRQLRAMPQYKFVPIVLLTTESIRKRNSKARLPARPPGSSNRSTPTSCWR